MGRGRHHAATHESSESSKASPKIFESMGGRPHSPTGGKNSLSGYAAPSFSAAIRLRCDRMPRVAACLTALNPRVFRVAQTGRCIPKVRLWCHASASPWLWTELDLPLSLPCMRVRSRLSPLDLLARTTHI